MKKYISILMILFCALFIGCTKNNKITITGEDTVKVGSTVTWSVKSPNANDTYKWTSSDESIALVESGNITGISEGKATITVSLENNSSIKASKDINVVSNGEVNISVSENNITLTVGESQKITVTPDVEVIWTSNDESIAIVNDGIITGKSKGKTTITVQTVDGTSIQTITVTVKNVETGYTVSDLMGDLMLVKEEYLTSLSANVSISFVEESNESNNRSIKLIYNKNADGSYRDLKYEIESNIVTALYIKDNTVYAQDGAAKFKYPLSSIDESILIDCSMENILDGITDFYNEASFYDCLEKEKENNDEIVYNIILSEYEGNVLNLELVEKATLTVRFTNKKLSFVGLKYLYVTGETKSINIEYLGTSTQEIDFPSDLNTYIEKN